MELKSMRIKLKAYPYLTLKIFKSHLMEDTILRNYLTF